MPKRNLLLCFDAFGTLFTPKRPVHVQYGEVARSLGLATHVSDEAIEKSFRAAFKSESRRNPNYGKDTGLDATKWWTNIIHDTFRPFLSSHEEALHPDLAPRLIHRFASEEGYTLFPDVLPFFRRLSRSNGRLRDGSALSSSSSRTFDLEGEKFRRVVVGIITNSDDRVPDVLSSLGLHVAPFRFGKDLSFHRQSVDDRGWDVDFCVMSYDVGIEKPDRRIFAAAERLAGKITETRRDEMEDWEKVYVGDDYEKDAVGAVKAGWKAIWIHRGDGGEAKENVESLEGESTEFFNDGSKIHTSKNLDELADALSRT